MINKRATDIYFAVGCACMQPEGEIRFSMDVPALGSFAIRCITPLSHISPHLVALAHIATRSHDAVASNGREHEQR